MRIANFDFILLPPSIFLDPVVNFLDRVVFLTNFSEFGPGEFPFFLLAKIFQLFNQFSFV